MANITLSVVLNGLSNGDLDKTKSEVENLLKTKYTVDDIEETDREENEREKEE
jgi:hypothetical protein